MSVTILTRLFEHHNWANRKIVEACLSLSEEQLDAMPQSATKGSIRSTLFHLVTAQRGYLRLLTLPREQRLQPVPEPPFAELHSSVTSSGEALLRLAQDEPSLSKMGKITTRDGSAIEPWVLMVQIVNHATEHREQIKSMLSALGSTPPEIDALAYGESVGALAPAEQGKQG